MAYTKRNYYEDSFVMNHYERLPEEFISSAAGTRNAATVTLVFSNAPTANETITLISTDGTKKTYTCKASANFENNEFSRAGSVHGADSLKAAIEHVDGHNGKILVSISTATLTLTQEIIGGAGNTVVTNGLSNVTNPAIDQVTNPSYACEDDDCDEIKLFNFTGGSTGHAPLSYATKGVRIRKNPDAYKTNLG